MKSVDNGSSAWRTERLDALCEKVVVGHVGPSSAHRDPAGIPFLMGKNVSSAGICTRNLERVSPQFHSREKKSQLEGGDIVVVRIGRSGTAAIVPPELCPANCSGLVIIKRPREVDSRYLVGFLNSTDGQQLTSREIKGSTRGTLNTKSVAATLVPLPPLPEQKRIAAILDAADALRAKRRASIEHLDSLVQSTFLEMFGDPVTNPKGWCNSPLGEVIRVKSGNALVARDMAPDGVFPVYGGNGVNGLHDRYMFDEPQVVVGRVGVYCGVVHLTAPKSWITDNALYVSETLTPIDTAYLVTALTNADLNKYAGRASQPLISGGRIYPVPIMLPPLPLQARFAAIVESIEHQKTRLKAHLAELDTLFASLQSRAFTGAL